jgi:hypothetical protein
MGTAFDEAWVQLMERAGWWVPGYRSADELWERMQETGGWWDPFYDHSNWKRVLQTASGHFEFRTDVLQLLSERKETSDFNLVQVNGEETASSTSSGSLALLLFEPLSIAGGIGAELPFLQELLDPGLETRWETWVELHPETAGTLGVRDRDWVRVSSPDGSIEARARVTTRVVPEATAIPIGLGRRTGGGRWARGIGVNPLELLSQRRENRSGLPETDTTRVQVTVVAEAKPSRLPERKV